ncbi:MAG: outer membrane beta-barrel protein [Prevotellaceae bacterium]|jgi:hypothetical protein|nr:outer membrane beta-barrel protein [Prevotellaceae bacterium]
MKRILLFICLFILSAKIYSQAVNLGFRGGLSIPNIIAGGGNPLSEGYSSRLAGSGGIFTEIGLNGTYSVRFGVEYTGQGGKRNGIQAMSSNQMVMDIATRMGAGITEDIAAALGQMAQHIPPVFYADVKNLAKFDYVMIPVSLQAGKNLGTSPYRIYANAGPFVSFLMSGEQVSEGSSRIYSDAGRVRTLWETIPSETQSLISNTVPELARILESETEFGTSVITGELRSVNFGVHGNLGLSYQYNKRNRFFVEFGGNYGFIRIQKNESNGSNRIGSANIMIGYSFGLHQ